MTLCKSAIECPHCGLRMHKHEEEREAMEIHREECHGTRDAEDVFEVGDRVKYSELGLRRLDRDQRVGNVVGFSREQDYWVRVHWDGNSESSSDRFEMAYIAHAFSDG